MPYVLIFCFPLKSNCKAFQKEWPWLSFTKTNVYEMFGCINDKYGITNNDDNNEKTVKIHGG